MRTRAQLAEATDSSRLRLAIVSLVLGALILGAWLSVQQGRSEQPPRIYRLAQAGEAGNPLVPAAGVEPALPSRRSGF